MRCIFYIDNILYVSLCCLEGAREFTRKSTPLRITIIEQEIKCTAQNDILCRHYKYKLVAIRICASENA